MHSIVNIPRDGDKHAVLTATTDRDHATVTVVNPHREAPYNTCLVCSMYIGEHLFDSGMHDVLRMMVAEAIRFAIIKGREAGYAQAQGDIRAALGVR